MEQFSPGDETAWERITAWIDESDAFILILGGRYGSIEPVSGKSYVELEYEYALNRNKPFFALVISEGHHEERVKDLGFKVDERDRRQEYSMFKSVVGQKLRRLWNDKKDIQAAIFQKLPEWAQRTDLIGWVRGDEATSPEAMNELARLSSENRELREQLKSSLETFGGLDLQTLVQILTDRKFSEPERQAASGLLRLDASSPLELFELNLSAFDILVGFGLLCVERSGVSRTYYITDAATRLRNRLLILKQIGAANTPSEPNRK